MSVTIYVEGGGNKNKDAEVRCKRGFREYCDKLCPQDRRPKIVACGGRDEAFKRFRIAIVAGKPGETFVLLVDSEGPVATGCSSVQHLGNRDGWVFPDLNSHEVFLMVQAMEAWFFADRATIEMYYGHGFQPTALRGSALSVENIAKDDLVPSLQTATRRSAKRVYHKTRHGFDILALIDPARVERGAPHAAEFHRFLRSL